MSKDKANSVKYSLTSEDIEKSVPFEFPIHRYNEIKKYDSLDSLLYPNGSCVIYFETGIENNSVMGHWTCMVKSPFSKDISKMAYVFFDPYGIIPDDEKDMIDHEYQEMIGQSQNTLSYLMSISDLPIEYNELPLQQMKPGLNTCGRHVICKLLSYQFPLEIYQEFMISKGSTPDEKVVSVTSVIMNDLVTPLDAMIRFNNLISEVTDYSLNHQYRNRNQYLD